MKIDQTTTLSAKLPGEVEDYTLSLDSTGDLRLYCDGKERLWIAGFDKVDKFADALKHLIAQMDVVMGVSHED